MGYNTSLTEHRNTDILKIIAIITMTIDHIGKVLFPEAIFLRIIGRIAFPIFAYLIALGYKRTSNYKRYVTRLLIFAVISIFPYYYFSNGTNIFFTLATGLVAIDYYSNKNYTITILIILLAQYTHMEYGWYGIAVILICYKYMNNYMELTISFLLLNIVYVFSTYAIIQLYSLLFLLFLPINQDLNFKLPRYFYYWFYPIHITIILLISKILI